jgi:hypothetical protein
VVVAPGRMIDSFLSIPDAKSLRSYRMVLKLACVCVTHRSSTPPHLHHERSCVLPIRCAGSSPESSPSRCTPNHPARLLHPLVHRCYARRSSAQAACKRRFHPAGSNCVRRPCPTGRRGELRRDRIQLRPDSPGAALRLLGCTLRT